MADCVNHSGTDENMNPDSRLFQRLQSITAAIMELDAKVEGGLQAIGVESRPVEITINNNRVQMQLDKMASLLDEALSAMLKRADELEQFGAEQDDAQVIVLGGYYRSLVQSIRSNPYIFPELTDSEAANNQPAAPAAVVERAMKRRQLLGGGMFAAALVAGLGGTMVAQKVHAVTDGGGSYALMARFEAWVAQYTVDAKSRYAQIIETINNIQGLFNALNAVNNAIIGGFDSLLSFTNENKQKDLVANMTAADQQMRLAQQNERIKAQQGSKAASGACVNDASSIVDEKLKTTVSEAGKVVSDKRVGAKISDRDGDKGVEVNAIDRTAELAVDVSRANVAAFNAGSLSAAPIKTGDEDLKNAQKAFSKVVAEPVDVIYGDLSRVASTASGKAYVATAATRIARRSVAEASLARITQSNVRDPNAFAYLEKNLKNLIRDTPPSMYNQDGEPVESVIDQRLKGHAEKLLEQLLDMAGSDKGISAVESLDFQVLSKSNSSFYEFVRSSGFSPSPLIREVIEQNSIMLKLMLEISKAGRETNAILSTLLMEVQDSPDRVERLNRLKRND